MPRVPRTTGEDLLRALPKAGWHAALQRGSHVILRQVEKRGRVVIPVHAGRILKPKTLLSIIDSAGISPEGLRGLL